MARFAERRQHRRQENSDTAFIVAGKPAALVDWSFGGLGVRFDPPCELDVAQEVNIRVLDRRSDSWDELKGSVRRVDPSGLVGIEFADEGEATVRVLLRVLGNRLMGAPI